MGKSHNRQLFENALECLHIEREIERVKLLKGNLYEQINDVNNKLAELENQRNIRYGILSSSVLTFFSSTDK